MHDAEHPGMQEERATAAIRLLVGSGRSVLRIVVVTKERLTIGRRPQNDVALDDLTVSGEHAAIETHGTESVIHDLDSRNGTLVNGLAVSRRVLCDGDVIDVGIYRLRFVVDRPQLVKKGDALAGWIDFLSGSRAGSSQRVERAITRIAGSAEQVAVLSRRNGRFHLTHLEGPALPQVNGEPIGLVACPLADGDLIELAGAMLRFRVDC
ncbi:MAG: FHA domain-containing protein [Burkholderiaceae bacterium]|jgi:predicted component of type VI protein secretion system|nr:FHA domain-containing protein [Burkholderiaceae bacterium]